MEVSCDTTKPKLLIPGSGPFSYSFSPGNCTLDSLFSLFYLFSLSFVSCRASMTTVTWLGEFYEVVLRDNARVVDVVLVEQESHPHNPETVWTRNRKTVWTQNPETVWTRNRKTVWTHILKQCEHIILKQCEHVILKQCEHIILKQYEDIILKQCETVWTYNSKTVWNSVNT